jgi:heme exporter protein B
MLRKVTDATRGNATLPTWTQQAWIVLRKDLRIEANSGEVITTSAFFALLVVVLASMSFHGGPRTGRIVMAGVVWLAIAFAAVLSLGRSWAREREANALSGILTSPLSPSALYAGKFVGLLIFLVAIEAVVFPVAALFFSVDLLSAGPGLVLIALFATPGIAAVGTLFGSMTVRTTARDLALSVVLFPLLSPVLLTAVAATRALLAGGEIGELGAYMRLLAVFDLAFLVGGLSLFGTLIED